ncbi:uncharacterized protein Dana_GF24356 [Drosophila ananassae]|uniref:Chitin-binding type-2 domain-containing protein n=1 Tax=Drosophila ananassae TaxID=7217 RepID=B3M5Y7_DROAN|nr:cell wall integrity and stress response component 3 [Drosophila ananassae]EDV39677.1 uncharacterized protein Dana_GF24356 [Drosophila ananassae]
MELLKLVAALGVLLAPVAVKATCNQCSDGHTCVSRTQFQFCDNPSVDQTIVYECPEDTPVCVDYGAICFPESDGIVAGCGDTSNCGVCSNDETFACTSRTTFALCSGGAVTANNINCTEDYVCSVSGAATGSPCISRCSATDGDICDVVLTNNEDNATTTTADPISTTTLDPLSTTTTDPSSTTTTDTTDPSSTTTTDTTDSSSTTTTDGSTITTTTSDANSTLSTDTSSDSTTEPATTTTVTTTITPPDFNEQTYCQGISAVGRYPIPNDTVCTSYVYCVYRGGSWSGLVYQCPATKPYFNANDFNCGTVQPTSAGCLL